MHLVFGCIHIQINAKFIIETRRIGILQRIATRLQYPGVEEQRKFLMDVIGKRAYAFCSAAISIL